MYDQTLVEKQNLQTKFDEQTKLAASLRADYEKLQKEKTDTAAKTKQ